MRIRIPGTAKALIVLTAAGLLLSGCHYHRHHYGGPHFAPPGHSYKHHPGKGKKHGHGHHRHGHRGYY